MSILQIFMCVRNIADALDDNNDFSEADPDLIIGTGLVVITHNRTERFHVYFINWNFCQHCQLYKSTLQFPWNGIKVCNLSIPNFATEKEQKRNFLDFNDVTLVVVDIKSERFVKSTCLQQDLFDMTMVTIMFDTKTSESESFIDRSIEGIINIMMEFHHF